MRTSIGSGLLQLGLTPGMGLGLYSVNCRGELHKDQALTSRTKSGMGLYSVNCRGELHQGEVLSVDFKHKMAWVWACTQ